MEISKEGFKTVKGIDGSIKLLFDSNRANECCNFAIAKKIKTISMYPGIYTSKELAPILPLKDFIEGLILDEKVDYSELDLFKNLTYLSVPDNKKNIVDVSNFLQLEDLVCNISTRLIGLEKCINLRSLYINNYKQNYLDLENIPKLESLETIRLFITDIVSLRGIEKFRNLKKIEIYNAPKLESICELVSLSNTLEDVQFERCKKIQDFESLYNLTSIKRLLMLDSGEIKSLSFIKNLTNLEFLSFGGTNILDGNLSYCEGINYVGFDDKKHYSHKFEYFNKKNIHQY